MIRRRKIHKLKRWAVICCCRAAHHPIYYVVIPRKLSSQKNRLSVYVYRFSTVNWPTRKKSHNQFEFIACRESRTFHNRKTTHDGRGGKSCGVNVKLIIHEITINSTESSRWYVDVAYDDDGTRSVGWCVMLCGWIYTVGSGKTLHIPCPTMCWRMANNGNRDTAWFHLLLAAVFSGCVISRLLLPRCRHPSVMKWRKTRHNKKSL